MTGESKTTQQLYDSVTKVKMSSRKKKTMRLTQGCLTNGHHSSNHEELEGNGVFKDISEGSERKCLVFSEEKKKKSAGKVKLGKKRRSLPVVKLD